MQRIKVLVSVVMLGVASVARAEPARPLPPVAEDIRVGNAALAQYDQYAVLVGDTGEAVDPAMTQRLEGIVKKLAAVSDLPSLPYEIRVIPNKLANAACAPGGKILLFTGVWDKKAGLVRANREDELAALLAHEMAHAAKRHHARKEAGEDLRDSAYEIEADAAGMLYMARAGYNPKSAVKIFKRLATRHSRDGHDTARLPRELREWHRAFASHPSPRARVKAMKQSLAAATAIYRESR